MNTIRNEKPADASAVRHVNEQAFGRPAEANLVEALTDHDAVTLSLVALDDTKIVGHILFSPVEIESDDAAFVGAGLGPMAVLPQCQRRGIGSQLVRCGLEVLRDADHTFVVVLGHPEFYPRFGFVPASRLGLSCTYDVPDEVFMAMELRDGGLNNIRGIARYRGEFDET
ncbi:MAG: N-acetyltransferase [Planctomycetes bacterium]|nr:N-acetyltransferase [Planctomycetota bacterium]